MGPAPTSTGCLFFSGQTVFFVFGYGATELFSVRLFPQTTMPNRLREGGVYPLVAGEEAVAVRARGEPNRMPDAAVLSTA